MNTVFQAIFEKIAVLIGSIAISLGIMSTPVIPTPDQPATLMDFTKNEKAVATPEGKLIIVVTPTVTPTPTPHANPCEIAIKAILSEVEQEYLKLETVKKARLEVEWCSYTENDPQKKIEDCQEWNEELMKRENQKIADKMSAYKNSLTVCNRQEVKFSKYSSKIPAEY